MKTSSSRSKDRRIQQILKILRRIPVCRKQGPKAKVWSVSLETVDDHLMKKTNRKFRGKNKTTDVLSFPAPSPFFEAGTLGVLLICEPELIRQAKVFKTTPSQEWDVLLVHGVLHLLGFDHENSARDDVKMGRLENQILAKLWPKVPALKRLGLVRRSRFS